MLNRWHGLCVLLLLLDWVSVWVGGRILSYSKHEKDLFLHRQNKIIYSLYLNIKYVELK